MSNQFEFVVSGFFLNSSRMLSHHLWVQLLHSSLNLSEESIQYWSLGIFEPVRSLRQMLLKILTFPLLKGSERESEAHVFVLLQEG